MPLFLQLGGSAPAPHTQLGIRVFLGKLSCHQKLGDFLKNNSFQFGIPTKLLKGFCQLKISLTVQNIKSYLIISFFQNSECPLDLPTLPSLPPSNLTSNSLNSEVLMQIYSGALHLAAHFSYMAEDWNEGQECKSSKVTNTLIDAFNR